MCNVFPTDHFPIRNNSFWALLIFQKYVIELKKIYVEQEIKKATFKLQELQIK